MSSPDEQALAPPPSAPPAAGRLPNFFIIGAMKAGTTSLYRYLSTHPEVFVPKTKEPGFFAKNWKLGLDWYLELFRDAGGAVAVGEGSTSYTKYPMTKSVPERMATLVPDARLIYLLRHPIDRMRSHYAFKYDGKTRPIDTVLLQEPHYLAFSSYAMQVDQYLRFFEREQMLLITSEELRTDRERTLRRVFKFLGVDPAFHVPNLDVEFYRTRNQPAMRRLDFPLSRRLGRHVPSPLKRVAIRVMAGERTVPDTTLSPETVRVLSERLAEDVRQLRQYMGEGFDGWGIA